MEIDSSFTVPAIDEIIYVFIFGFKLMPRNIFTRSPAVFSSHITLRVLRKMEIFGFSAEAEERVSNFSSWT